MKLKIDKEKKKHTRSNLRRGDCVFSSDFLARVKIKHNLPDSAAVEARLLVQVDEIS